MDWIVVILASLGYISILVMVWYEEPWTYRLVTALVILTTITVIGGILCPF